MSTVTEEPEVAEPITGELIVDTPKEIPIVFNVSDSKIAELKTSLAGLKINDKKDYDRAVKGIAACRTLRSSVEKCRKGLKEHALAYGRKVDAEATRLREALEAIEEPLKSEKERVDEAAAKAKREAEEAKRKIVEERIKALVGFECVLTPKRIGKELTLLFATLGTDARQPQLNFDQDEEE